MAEFTKRKGPSCSTLIVAGIVTLLIMAACSSMLRLGAPSEDAPQRSKCSLDLPTQDYFDCLKLERNLPVQ